MKHFLLVCLSFCLGGASMAQTITNVSPNSGSRGTWNLPITITGSGTNFSSATNTIVEISQNGFKLEVLSANVTSNTTVDAMVRIPHYSFLGVYDVTVFDQAYGMTGLPGGFTVYASPNIPSITETYPDTVRQNATLPITISTEYTNFSQATDNTIYLTQGTHTLYPIPGTMQVLSNELIRASFDFNQPFLPIGTLVNSHCGNSFDGILSDPESILIIDSTLNIFESKPDGKLFAYPNPTLGELSINIPKGLINFEFSVYNQLGQKIIRQSVQNNSSDTFKTNISNLPKGVYYVRMHNDNKSYRMKIIKD